MIDRKDGSQNEGVADPPVPEDSQGNPEFKMRPQDDSVRNQLWNILQDGGRTLHGRRVDTPESLFKAIDKNEDEQISEKELKVAMKRLGPGLSDEQIHSMLTDLDLDNDGAISLSELTQWLSDTEQGVSRIRGKIRPRKSSNLG